MSTKSKLGYWFCTGTLAHTLLASAAFAQDSTPPQRTGNHPFCSDASFDSDGDGWGWENQQTCIVVQSRFPICSSAEFDSDGDGWGWENNRSCLVQANGDSTNSSQDSSQNTFPTCSDASTDPDGDGFGWEFNRTCIVDTAKTSTDTGGNPQNTFPTCSNASTDTDGDGYGWENNQTCVVEVSETTSQTSTDFPTCSDASTDSDGDGYGWEFNITCIVDTAKNSTNTGGNSQNTFPTCSDASTDTDNDGYGWENNQTCIVDISETTTETSTDFPECNDASTDPDGDGYGWEFNRTCIVNTAKNSTDTNGNPQNTFPVCNNEDSDPDGDGYGWENNQTCVVTATDTTAGKQPGDTTAPKAPPVVHDGDAQAVVTRDENNPFSKFQLDDTLYTNNVYDNRQLDFNNNGNLIFYNGVQDFVRWEVPASLGNNPNPCVRLQSADPVTLSYRLTSRKDSPTERNSFVRAFPAMVVGTMGGRFESWGVECGVTQPFLTNIMRHGGSPVFQMETVAAATGMPVKAAELDYDVRVSVKAELLDGDAANGVANVFMDSYWHDVSDQALVPGASRNLVDTINGVNSNFTEVWNLNIWFDYPRFEGSASSWTGGFRIGSVSFNEGGKFDVHFKIEGARDGHRPRCVTGESDNCFLYIGLVAADSNASRNGVTVNYTEIAQWMRSAAFRDLFLVGASEKDTNACLLYTSPSPRDS